MIEQFISQTIKLMKKSDIVIRPTEIRTIKLGHGDNSTSGTMYVSDSYGGARFEDNFILQNMIMFSLIDALVDRNYPDLVGESFHKKYTYMTAETDEQIMFREIYRILKVLRNASVHSMNSVSIRPDKSIVISYRHRDTLFSLNIPETGMAFINTFIYNLINPPISLLTKNHLLGIQRSLYDHIKELVTTFSDEFGSTLEGISDGVRLKTIVRYYIQNPLFEISTDSIKITSEYKLNSDYERHYGVDYQINIGSKTAILPAEVLKENSIELNNLENWYKN